MNATATDRISIPRDAVLQYLPLEYKIQLLFKDSEPGSFKTMKEMSQELARSEKSVFVALRNLDAAGLVERRRLPSKGTPCLYRVTPSF